MINKLWNLTWYAYIGASLLDPRFSVQYIGRYTKRAVMAEYRIVYYDGTIVRFSYKDYAQGGKISYITMKVHTFIGRLIRHIPDKHFPMIRYAGLFTNRWRKKYLAMARIALNQSESDDHQEDTHPCWAERQAEYTGNNPLFCPDCAQPMVFVGSFFGIKKGQPFVWEGHDCHEGVVISTTYKNNHGEIMKIDPKSRIQIQRLSAFNPL